MEDNIRMAHSLIVEDRKKFTLTGVKEVTSFDEQTVMLDTSLGKLVIKGSGLHISLFNTEKGELSGDGTLNALVYTAEAEPGGFFSRLFK